MAAPGSSRSMRGRRRLQMRKVPGRKLTVHLTTTSEPLGSDLLPQGPACEAPAPGPLPDRSTACRYRLPGGFSLCPVVL